MKFEIKQRIIQLNNGEVPNGYEKTEFGIFPCDWVVDKRLKDIGTFGKGKGLPGDKLTLEGVPCVGYGDIYMKYNNFHFEKAKSFVDKETASKSQPIQKGTLLFTGTGETAEEIGKCVCYNGDETIYAGGDIITFISNEVNPLFLAYQQYQDFSLRNKASFGQGHSVVHIRQNNLEKLHVAYPKSADEQSKIAEILMKWDEAIELYNQYIEKLKQLKSIWLKKMFPQKDERVPERRFKGFTDAWEQRKLGELSEKTYGGGTPSTANTEYWHGDIPWLQSSDIIDGKLFDVKPKKYISQLGLNNSAAQLVPANSIAIITRVGVGKLAFLPFSYTTSQDFLSMSRLTAEPYFTVYACYKKLQSELNSVQGTSIKGITKDELLAKEIKVPSYEEQKQIGAYFRSLDNLITLHQCKVEKIKAQQKVLQKYLLNGIVRV